jgi:hypothetical protein
MYLLRRLPRPQDVGTPSNSWHTCLLGGYPYKYYPGSTLLDFDDQMSTGMFNVGPEIFQLTLN